MKCSFLVRVLPSQQFRDVHIMPHPPVGGGIIPVTYSPKNPLDVELKETIWRSLYCSPISWRTLRKEWNFGVTYTFSWYTWQNKRGKEGGERNSDGRENIRMEGRERESVIWMILTSSVKSRSPSSWQNLIISFIFFSGRYWPNERHREIFLACLQRHCTLESL